MVDDFLFCFGRTNIWRLFAVYTYHVPNGEWKLIPVHGLEKNGKALPSHDCHNKGSSCVQVIGLFRVNRKKLAFAWTVPSPDRFEIHCIKFKIKKQPIHINGKSEACFRARVRVSSSITLKVKNGTIEAGLEN